MEKQTKQIQLKLINGGHSSVTQLCGGYDLLTAPTGNFLRVNAQMHNLDKQKTTSSRKTLATI